MQNKIILISMLALGLMVPLFFKKDTDDTKIGGKTKPSDGSKKNDANTITDTQARTIALRIFGAMDMLGTDEDSVFRNLETLNGASLQKVYTAFGSPKYWAGEESALFGNKTDLFGWFEGEFDNEDLQNLRSIFAKSNLKWT